MKKLIFTGLIFLLLILLTGCCCVVPSIPEELPPPEPCYTLINVDTIPSTICQGDSILIKGRVWSSLGENLSYEGIPVELYIDGKHIKTIYTEFCGYFKYNHKCAHLLEPCSHYVKAVAQYGDCELGFATNTFKVIDCSPPPPPDCGPEGCFPGEPGPDPE